MSGSCRKIKVFPQSLAGALAHVRIKSRHHLGATLDHGDFLAFNFLKKSFCKTIEFMTIKGAGW